MSENKEALVKQGIDMENFDHVVALAGNPNTGKSTVFNALTGLRQHTGNWPGKTVTRAEGAFQYKNQKYKLVDLPGTYSLLSTSTDEEVARNFILFGKPAVTIIVADATRLQRNLNLALQILEITDNAVLCLNLIDEANRNGIEVNVDQLEKELGIPVVPTAARNGKGIDKLLEMISKVANGEYECNPYKIKYSQKINSAIEELSNKIKDEFPELPNVRWVALRLLEGDQTIINSIKNGELGKV